MSLDDIPAGNSPRPTSAGEAAVRRVDRASDPAEKITRAEELRLQLADEIVRGALAPGAPLDETEIARRLSVAHAGARGGTLVLLAWSSPCPSWRGGGRPSIGG
jgi:hypothetical protein